MLNGRPLTAVSDDPDDLEALTPAHFLVGRPNPTTPMDTFCEKDLTSRKRWRQCQIMTDHIWRRWRREYLPTLTERNKWLVDCKQMNVGNLVLIAEDNESRGRWHLGKVAKLLPGSDGRVRSVEVRTAVGTMVRPVAKLCLLEENHE